jgi:hypothetical protein
LAEQLSDDSERAGLIAKYLKKIQVHGLRLSDFKPSKKTVEKSDVDAVVNEFRSFLESAFKSDGKQHSIILEFKEYQLKDMSTGGGGITGRDVRGIEKTLSGLLKLLYPHGELSDAQLGELLELALECRQRVRNQLHLMAPGEYGPIKLGAKMVSSGKEIVPTLPDAYREQKVSLPSSPRVGEITGLAVIGDDRGCLLHFEVQASKGSGRIVSLGSMQRVMKESVAAAAQFVKVHAKALGLPTDWQDNQDVAVLATMMGVPKEGPSAGITITTGIVSALTGKAVRNDIAMTGEITIMGKVLGVGGILVVSNGTATADGIEFGPTTAGSNYISLHYHRGGHRPDKNFWIPTFPPPEEFSLFDVTEMFADSALDGWRAAKRHLWAVHAQGQTILGVRGERLAKFPHPQNAIDRWHGYPVSPQEREDDTPPDELIDLWIERGVIPRVLGRRIQRRKV